MKNYRVSQMYPGSKSNTITLKLVRMNVPKNGVEDAPTYTAMMSFYNSIGETLELTGICEMTFSLDKY